MPPTWPCLSLLLPSSSLSGWIDPATPDDAQTITSLGVPSQSSSRQYALVFSDEFDSPHRQFTDGHDPRWTALDKNDYTNDALHFYSSSQVFTDDGQLVIRSELRETTIIGFNDVTQRRERVQKHFVSGMMQTWNKFCFTGGVVEAEMALPGRHDVGGLWPAFWMLGNLARHTYVGSSEHVWPWSSGICTEKSRTSQLVSGCGRVSHYGMERGRGRGAPEIDVFEVQAGSVKANTGAFLKMPVGQPFMSSSYQVAPGRLPRPGEGWWPAPGQWYSNLTGGTNTSLNIVFYGTYNHFRDDVDPAQQDYWSDAISYNRQLTHAHFGNMHRYRLEWDLPADDNQHNDTHAQNNDTNHGYLRWFIDDEFVLEIKGDGLNESGTGAEISTEPMYLLLNTAISSQWGFPSQCPDVCPCKTYNCNGGFQETCGFSEGFCDMMKGPKPVEYRINYVRVYQDENDPRQKVGCSTPERPTRKFIQAHQQKYMLEGDIHPLKPIQNGGGPCTMALDVNNTNSTEFCGGPSKGICHSKKSSSTCQCLSGWTGPYCTNPTGFDDIIWDPPDSWADLGFNGPSLTILSGSIFVLGIVTLFGAPFVFRKRRRRRKVGGWISASVNGLSSEH